MKKKYYDSQAFSKDSEISEIEALEKGSYVVCYLSENKPEYAEHIKGKKVQRVIHFVQQWPNEIIFQKQLSRKDKTPFEFALPSEYIADKEVKKYYCFKAEGEFDFILEYHVSSEGNLLLEIHRDDNYSATSSTEYEYDDAGELLFIREYNAEGRLVSELDYVDSMMPG
jgi:hypothetical protein